MIRKILLLSIAVPLLACRAIAQDERSTEWKKIVEAARKEGKVVASIPPSAELRRGMELAFTRRYGVGVEFVPARGSTIIRRIADEAKAGIHYFDLHIGGTESVITGLLPENVLEPVEPFFILPEVKDPRQWWGGHIWVDRAKRFVYAFVAYQTVSLWCNPNEYNPADFHSFDDLLGPKLRGRIGISDPRTPGSGSSMWSYMLYIKGEEYLKRLVAQKPFVTRDLRLLGENLAKGKIAITSGIGYSELLPFIKAKLPVHPLPVPREGLYATGGYGHLTILRNHPHPNATRVFVNWLLGRDGQEIFSRAMGVGTRRLDVDTRWTREFGVIAAKDGLTLEQYYKFENQSEEKIHRIREPGSAAARRLLGS
ncbi:MAG TPA: extracellular solute-binding protein [candidate division Zixibacteria bacterium]|nr:extracellular solute-binding protein [candidate division Zixibacteria bacterium]